MPILTGTVVDVAGRPATGTIRVRASHVRQSASGDATVDERTYDIPIRDGVIEDSPNIDPGPAKLSLSTGGRFRAWDVTVPDTESVDLWDLLEAQAEYEPAVVSRVYQDRLKAEAAAQLAEQVAEGIGDVADDVAAVAADRTAVEAARSDAIDARTGAETARDQAENFQALSNAAALTATQKAEDAEAAALQAGEAVASAAAAAVSADTAGMHASNAAGSASIAAGHASDAEDSAQAAAQSAQDAADAVNSGVPNATDTVKGGIMLAGDLGGTFDAPTVPGLSSKLDQSQVDARVSAGIADWVNGAPAALDTLQELADALGNDPNFATTVSNQIGLKAPLESPALTGTPTVGGKAVVVTDDPRLSDARTPTSHTHPATDIQGSTTVGRAVLSAADGAAARSAIGAARADMMPELVSELPASPIPGKLYCLPEE